MSNGLKDALGFYIPGADDPTEKIPLFSPKEWEELSKEFDYNSYKPKCECGCDKTYGANNNLHATWCPKYAWCQKG